MSTQGASTVQMQQMQGPEEMFPALGHILPLLEGAD